ncbi:MAG TPA: UDP-N-acetylmuramate--L-alanine ligase [Candidatus Omnitrophota bacterium]|nr:UDP-N-acetylmuramate--L-alanine ligase [Candidatus Omnitrophota bacterium]HPS36754.1 UDP-N-acetylmuramate--L-alanine ligase [Candidatus Omnitrophota bacterium]
MKIVHENLIRNSREVYLIGIGGAGMSGLARILKHLGLSVSGSDSKESYATRALRRSGIPVNLGQKDVGFGSSDLIIYSSAIKKDHLELQTARRLGRKVHHRAEVLASLLNHAATSIGVLGTHGKTTTSAMISYVLSKLGANPTCFVGSEMLNFDTNVVAGGRDYWVCEVDESDSSHEYYAPNYSVITNLEPEHLDHYQNWENLTQSFRRFLSQVRDPGLVAYWGDDPALNALVTESGRPHVSFGFSEACVYSAQNIRLQPFGSEFDLFESGFFSLPMRLSVPGRHNIANALATLSILLHLGFDLEEVRDALATFKGTRRRMEIKYQNPQFLVLDDYAHHPTEVKAVLRALHEAGKYVRVIFQPHRFSRTKNLCFEFARAFDDAEEVVLTDIYGAGEANPTGVDVEVIYREVRNSGHPHVSVIHKEQIIPYLLEHPLREGGVMVFMGAGDIGEVANEFVRNIGACTPA